MFYSGLKIRAINHSHPLLGKMKTHCSRLSLDWTIYISVLLGKWPNIECNSDIVCRYLNRKCFLGSRCSRSTTSCWLFAKIHCSCGCVISHSSLSMGILRCWDSKGNIDLENLTFTQPTSRDSRVIRSGKDLIGIVSRFSRYFRQFLVHIIPIVF